MRAIIPALARLGDTFTTAIAVLFVHAVGVIFLGGER